ncbi:unnamed protein product [Rotaria sp. Silwood1]|nr:unnamed protein product [Rotaria sp. Silwood1]
MTLNGRMSYMNSIDIKTKSHLCNESEIYEDPDEHHAPYKLMFLFFILFIGCLFKTIFVSLRVPYAGLIILIGFIGGILFNIFTKDDTFLTITTSSPDLVVGIFLPALVFESAYRIEYHAFMKSLYSILLFSIVGYFISLFSISTLNKCLFLFQQWTFLQCLILGIILSATRPITLMRQADYGKTKRLSIILEGEAIINNSLAIILFNAIKSFVVDDQLWHTFKFFKTAVVALVGGIGFGGMAGILEIICLPHFYDDPISEVTITTAIPYMLYWLCEQLYSSGIIAIVVLGLILSNHKTALSSEAAIFMEKFVMIIILTLCINLFRNCHLSWKECFLATWGDFKGSICLILCLALKGEFQLANKQLIHHASSKFKYQILIYTTIIVFLSSCMNSTYSLLLKILNFTKMSETKYLYMAQCVDSLRTLVKEKICLLKKNKYLANADWIFIEENFHIENPHTMKMINNDSRDINLIDHDIKCSICHRPISMEFNQIQYDDVFEEARIRIINIQKTSFWRQYRDYEISTQAVRILSSLCDFAIDSEGQYISIDQLKYYYKPRTIDFIWKYLIYTFGIQIYFRTWIDYRIEFILLILVVVECIFEYYYRISTKFISHQTWSIMQILVIIQIIRLIRTIEYIIANLNILLERIANRYVTLSLELCKAYILSEDDVLSKLHRVIEIDQIREHFHKDSIRRRDEIINELTFIQSEHPNVSASVKTRAAIQKLLNYSKNIIHHMTNKGLLGENEAHRITEFNFLHVFPWLHDPDVLEYVLSHLHVKSFSLNEYIYKVNNDSQALFFITAGYVETIRNMPKYHDALSIEKFHKNKENNSSEDIKLKKDSFTFNSKSNYYQKQSYEINSINESQTNHHLCHQCYVDVQKIDIIDKNALLNEDLFQWSDIDSEQKYLFFDNTKKLLNVNESILSQLNINDSILDFFPTKESTTVYRLLYAPGDVIGHIDLLNGQKYTETCKCITNTLVWYLKSNDLIVLIERFKHLKILEKIWHYSALQLAEGVLYEYLNIVPYDATEQERFHIYSHLKHAFLLPESYLIEHKIIYSSHELILIQGQLENIISSLIYTGPCFIQIEFGQYGLKPLNISETKILVLRNSHYHDTLNDEFVLPLDLPGLLTHIIYDEKLDILLPRSSIKYEHIVTQSNIDQSSKEMTKKTLLGRFLESLPKFQRRIMNP